MKSLIRLTLLIVAIIIISSITMAGEINQANNGEQSLITAVINRTITYQGILKTNTGTPVPDNTYNLTFRIYKQPSGGSALWTSANMPVITSSGLFSTQIGPISLPFDTTYSISIQVQGDAEMSRQMMTMTPYSASSDTANYAFDADLLDGQHASAFSIIGHTHVITSTEIQDGTIQFIDIGQNGAANGQVMKWNGSAWVAGNDSSLDNKWSLRLTDTADTTLITGGQWGIARSGNLLWGNTDSTHVNLGVQCTTGTSVHNYKYCTVGGGYRNAASGEDATVGGGVSNTASNYNATIGGGYFNTASGNYATVGGGVGNTASGGYATVGGGGFNIASGSDGATIGGGASNTASGIYATVGGGVSNTASGNRATVGGGYYNAASDSNATVGGGRADSAKAIYSGVASGYSNLAGDAPEDTGAFVGGGYNNTVTGKYSTISGGKNNTAGGDNVTIGGGTGNAAGGGGATVGGGINNTANGGMATVGGGYGNTAGGAYAAVCGGYNNRVDASYSLVAGGDRNSTSGSYSAIIGGQLDTIVSASYSLAFGNSVYISSSNRAAFFDGANYGYLGINRDDHNGGISYPIHVGTNTSNGNGAYLSPGGIWSPGISRAFIENPRLQSGTELLNKISSLSIASWNYKNSSEKHISPNAEEFVGAFDVGVIRESDGKRDNQYLAASDVAGVALAGVQELMKIIEAQNKKIEELQSQISELKNR
jgi:hypothetical protein